MLGKIVTEKQHGSIESVVQTHKKVLSFIEAIGNGVSNLFPYSLIPA